MKISRPPSVVVFGCGQMGLLITRLLVERGVDVLGAVARRPNLVGKDVGEMAGVGPLGVTVSDNPQEVLASTRPDIAVIATTSPLATIADHARMCLNSGVNVVTLEEQSFFPWRVEPRLAADLDQAARAKGVTMMGTGLQDVWWALLPALLMASAHRVERVVGRTTWNTDDFGPPSTSDDPIVGKPPKVLHQMESDGVWDRPTVPPVLHAVAALANLTPAGHRVSVRPLIATQDTPSRHGATVHTGTMLGFAETVTLDTAEGAVIQLEMAGYLHAADEHSVNEWRVFGDPYLEVISNRFDARLGTCLGLVNRIADIIEAEPGLATVSTLPFPRHRPGPLVVEVPLARS